MAKKKKKKASAQAAHSAGRRGGCLATLAGLGCFTSFGAGGIAAISAVVAIACVIFGYEYLVVWYPGEDFDPKHIQGIIAQESPIVYRDGTTRVGVFFEDEHRVYLGYDDLPPAYVAAIVAAEDETFFTHWGMSGTGLLRAVYQNVTSGSVKSGGSTLTQQTAKNLFYRPDRSIKSKLNELLNALRLEAHFDKQQILTFYANQFHVSGNGRGVGIAARYFFDKDTKDLSVVECAFLAGLVKGPTNYDPFGAKTEEKRDKAIERAHDRTMYVLRRLSEVPTESLAGPGADATRIAQVKAAQDEAARLLASDFKLPFQEGTFRYDSNAVLDEVARRMKEAPFDKVLADAGIDDPATGGLTVITTLDEGLQREAVYGLWHHLTEVGAMLEAPKAAAWLLADAKVPFDPDEALVRHEFHVAKVKALKGDAGKKWLLVDLGGQDCEADRDAVTRAALVTYRGEQQNKNAKVSATYVDAFTATFAKDAVVWVSLRDVPAGKTATSGLASPSVPLCDLERRPELQGSTVVVQDGEVRAMVGGNDNKNFNRAEAPRQMGSTWKPANYHAAIELGWLPSDPLYNKPNVFPWQGTFYYPTSDHTPSDVVSLSWAGVNSENIASVWLLYHLTDRLTEAQVKALAADLEYGPSETPSEGWKDNVRKAGITVSKGRIADAALERAKADVIAGLPAKGHPEDELAIRSLYAGGGFAAERARVVKAHEKEMGWKLEALDHAWDRVGPLTDACRTQYQALADGMASGVMPAATAFPDLRVAVRPERVDVACGYLPEDDSPWTLPSQASLGRLMAAADEPAEPVTEPLPPPTVARPAVVDAEVPKGRGRGRPGVDKRDNPPPSAPRATPSRPRPLSDRTWSSEVATYNAGPIAPIEDVIVDGNLHLGTLNDLRAAFDYQQSYAPADPWDAKNLYWNPDFRTRLGIAYLAEIARRYGVRSDLVEGLPLTLGASEVTIEEATAMYDGIVHGRAMTFPGEGDVPTPAAPTLLIAEVRDVDGNVLYKAKPTPVVVASSPETGELVFDVLRNIVLHGTASKADGAVKLGGGVVPLGGKTGTTNDYRNSAFLGFVPRVDGAEFVLEGGYAIGTYVGYDDNRPMDVGNIKMAGAVGAMPAWLGAARGLADLGLLGAPTTKGKGTWPVRTSADLVRHPAGEHGLVGEGIVDVSATSVLTRDRAPNVVPAEIPHLPRQSRVLRGMAAIDNRRTVPRKNR